MVRQHHATRSYADTFRGVRNVTDHQFRNGARDQARVVVLGEPKTRVAEFVGEPREINCIVQSLRAGRTGRNRRKVKHREPVA